MPFLEIRDLTYTYPNSGVRAISGFNMDADRGEMIAVIGPNAAGKSTFAQLLKGLIRSDSGKIRIKGTERVTAGPDPGIGILFSNPENQLVTSIVEEDVAFGLEVMGEPSKVIRDRVGDTLERLGIVHLRKRLPHLMSGGEQQMAALAGVLVLDPDILILDEPTTYLDPHARSAVLTSMRRLADKGKVIILITHDMNEAAVADRVILLDQGCIESEGKPEEIFSQPGLADRYGIYPPFLLNLVFALRSRGIDVKWPSDPVSLAGILKNRLYDRSMAENYGCRNNAIHDRKVPALVFDKVCFSYGNDGISGGTVLSGVDFSVEQGSIALVCGANGSGKSTLLQMSNGLITPDDGEILLCGRHLKYWKNTPGGIPGRVAMMFQNPERQVFSDTVFDDIAFGPRNLGISTDAIEKRVLKAAQWAGLSDAVLNRPVFTLSGGQMRRVAVAGILAMESEVLVLDEPTDGLDPGGAREFFCSARRYCDETGTTVIAASHAVPEQITRIDHLGHLDDGKMQSSGPPCEILAGGRRTLPEKFLPDHLILREQLLEIGSALPDETLEPSSALKYLLDVIDGERHDNDV